MATDNTVTQIGNLTDDPELRGTIEVGENEVAPSLRSPPPPLSGPAPLAAGASEGDQFNDEPPRSDVLATF